MPPISGLTLQGVNENILQWQLFQLAVADLTAAVHYQLQDPG